MYFIIELPEALQCFCEEMHLDSTERRISFEDMYIEHKLYKQYYCTYLCQVNMVCFVRRQRTMPRQCSLCRRFMFCTLSESYSERMNNKNKFSC